MFVSSSLSQVLESRSFVTKTKLYDMILRSISKENKDNGVCVRACVCVCMLCGYLCMLCVPAGTMTSLHVLYYWLIHTCVIGSHEK